VGAEIREIAARWKAGETALPVGGATGECVPAITLKYLAGVRIYSQQSLR
jgi:hypothetical protein